MEVYEAIYKRSSVRGFTGDEVPQETVRRMLEAASRAPTAGNLQPWRFYVVRDKRIKRLLAEAAWGQSFVSQAPVVIVFCADLEVCERGYGSRGRNLYSIQDTSASVENLLLCVVEEGLGACWVGAFDESRASAALGLSPGIRPLAIVPIGKPSGTPRPTGRETFENYTEYV